MKRVTLVVTDATAKALVGLCENGYLKGYTPAKDIAWGLASIAKTVNGRRNTVTLVEVDGRTYEVSTRRYHYSR